jgi:hypothetical protein
MPEKRSKYDTDPLDPDFARRTEEMSGGATGVMQDAPTEHLSGATRPMQPADQARLNPEGEAPTRLIDEKLAQPYQSVFVPPAYQPPRQSTFGQQPPPQNFAPQGYAPPPHHPQHVYAPPARERSVAGLGIPEKFACALPYAPFKIGLVVAIIELLITPRAEGRTRFHAAQGLALQLGILAVQIALSVFSNFGGGNFGGFIFSVAALVFLVYSFVRVWRGGGDYRIVPLEDAVRWLDTKIDAKK